MEIRAGQELKASFTFIFIKKGFLFFLIVTKTRIAKINWWLKLDVTIVDHPLKAPMVVDVLQSPVSPPESCLSIDIQLSLSKSLVILLRSSLNFPFCRPFPCIKHQISFMGSADNQAIIYGKSIFIKSRELIPTKVRGPLAVLTCPNSDDLLV